MTKRMALLTLVVGAPGLLLLLSVGREGAVGPGPGRTVRPGPAPADGRPAVERAPPAALRGRPAEGRRAPRSPGVHPVPEPSSPGAALRADLVAADPGTRMLAIEALSDLGGEGARLLLARAAANPAVTEAERAALKEALRRTRGGRRGPAGDPRSP